MALETYDSLKRTLPKTVLSQTRSFGLDFNRDQSGSQVMINDDAPSPILDPEDALEAKLRLGVLANSLTERIEILCTDVSLLRLPAAGQILKRNVEDLSTLVAAIETLERLSVPQIYQR